MYENQKEWSGYRVRESKKGWIIEGWSRIQGNKTNYKYLVPFSTKKKVGSLYPAETNLTAAHNEFMEIGQYIAEVEKEFAQVLEKGYIVE